MRHLKFVPAVLLAAFVAAGCGKSSTAPAPAMSQSDADDVAQQIAVTSVGTDWGSYVLQVGAVPAAQPAPAHVRPVRPSRAQWDTTFARGGLTYDFSLAFFTHDLTPQVQYDPYTTWKIDETSNVTGSVDTTNFHADFFHTGGLTFTGTRVTDDTLKFSGSAHDTAYSHFTSEIRNVERWFHLDLVRTVTNVTIVHSIAPYPQSGTVTWVVSAQRLRSSSRGDVEANFDGTATLTFNGTRYPTLTVSGDWTYRVDLATGAIARL